MSEQRRPRPLLVFDPQSNRDVDLAALRADHHSAATGQEVDAGDRDSPADS